MRLEREDAMQGLAQKDGFTLKKGQENAGAEGPRHDAATPP